MNYPLFAAVDRHFALVAERPYARYLGDDIALTDAQAVAGKFGKAYFNLVKELWRPEADVQSPIHGQVLQLRYWMIATGRARNPKRSGDKAAIESIESLLGGDSAPIGEMMSSTGGRSAIERLAHAFSSNDVVLKLFDAAIRIVESAPRRGVTGAHRDALPELVTAWKVARQHHRPPGILDKMCINAVSRNLKTNWRVAENVRFFFGNADSTAPPQALSSDAIAGIRNTVESSLARCDAADILASAEGATRYTLYQLSYGVERIRRGDDKGPPFDGWNGFARHLLDAAYRNQHLIVPQILAFFSRRRSESTAGSVSPGKADALFGLDNLLPLLRSTHQRIDNDRGLDQELRRVIQELASFAASRTSEQPGSSRAR